MEASLAELNQKIDALTAQVAYLTEQAQEAEKARIVRQELVEVVNPIAKDAMRLAGEQFEEVQDYIRPEDLVRLLKKAVRQGPKLEALLDQADSVADLLDVSGPILHEAVDKLTQVMAALEQKGYFAFGSSGLRMADNIVTSFSQEDVDRLGDNIVLILNTVKDMTQPEIMQFVRNTLLLAEQELDQPVNTSMTALLRQMGDPAVRRGLALTLHMLRAVGRQANGNGHS